MTGSHTTMERSGRRGRPPAGTKEDSMTAALRTRLAAWLAAGFVGCFPALARAETFTLGNGVTLEGSYSTISSVGSDPLKAVGSTELKQIAIIDNRLTRTFVR